MATSEQPIVAGRHPTPSALDVQRIRDGLALFCLPAPEQLSAEWPKQATTAPSRLQAWRDCAINVASAGLQAPETPARLRSLMQGWNPAPLAKTEACDPHDVYFHIARVGSEPGEAYLRGIVAALAIWLDEVTHEQERRAHAAIGDALLELWLRALNLDAVPAARHEDLPSQACTPQPIRRWLRGHHVFAVLTQGLIWSLLRLQSAGEKAPAEQVVDLLGLMTRLYRASAVAFRFTANFDPQIYSDVIRPSMSEPHVPPGFSGSMSVDHGHLVALLSKQRSLLATCGARFPGVYGQLREALSEVYDCHRHVCERFVSPEGPSLRTDRLCGDNAAVTMIDRFKARRLDMLR